MTNAEILRRDVVRAREGQEEQRNNGTLVRSSEALSDNCVVKKDPRYLPLTGCILTSEFNLQYP